MSLQRTMLEIKNVSHFANEEVSEMPRETLGGRMARQRKAQEELKSLTETYRQQLLASSVFILVTGSERDQFLKTATEDFKFFSADADQFYADIANSLSADLYVGKESSSNLLDVISRVLENKALEVGIVGYPMLTFRQEHRRLIKDKADLIELIKEIVSTQIGAEVVGAQATKTILSNAIASGHDGNTTPVLLSVSGEKSLVDTAAGLERITRRVYVITAGKTEIAHKNAIEVESVSKKSVEKALRILRANMNNRTIDLSDLDEKTEAELVDTSYDLEKLALQSADNFGPPMEMLPLSEEEEIDLDVAIPGITEKNKTLLSNALKAGSTANAPEHLKSKAASQQKNKK